MAIVEFLVQRIKEGKLEFNKVPEKYKEEVKKILEE